MVKVKMTNRLIICCVGITCVLFGAIFFKEPAAMAIAENVADEIPKENESKTNAADVADSITEKSKILTLNFLRDTDLSIQQIQQQAINIYLEVTRKDVQPTDKAILAYPKSISEKALLKTTCYMPPRAERLFIYVGTMEPIIHIFANDVSDTKSGVTRVFVPKIIKAELSPLWQDWANGIQSLNEHLSAIYQLANEEKPDNIAIGKRAVAMYKIGNNLNNTLETVVEKIRKIERKGIQSESVGIQ